VAHILRTHGAQVTQAQSGKEALAKAEGQEFDIILMDIQMPQLDGNQTTTQLRSRNYKKPILALTANALVGEKEKSLSAGFDDYLTKPIDIKKLVEVLQKYRPQMGESGVGDAGHAHNTL